MIPSCSTPGITLLIPCYNAGRYLPRLIESVQRQSMSFATTLCYDDGSTDDTVAVARRLGLEIITGNSNAGVARARNRLAAAARTEWIHFHDADDILGAKFLARLSPACTAEADVVSCDADWLYEETRVLEVAWRYDPEALRRDPVSHLIQHGMGFNSSIIRRSAWAKSGGCDESLAIWEDADTHIRLAADGARFHHFPEVHTYSLRHADSFSHDYQKNARCRLYLLEKYAETLPSTRPAIGREAELLAERFLGLRDEAAARRTLALCRRIGHRMSVSSRPLLRIARAVLPPILFLKLRYRRRHPC